MKRQAKSVVSCLGLVVALVVGGSHATPRGHLSCGDVVSGHVVLDADLNCACGPGLIVGADGTTIDLNGFAIRAAGAGYLGSCQGIPAAVGIDTNGHSNVLIKGPGTIDGFHVGVHVNGGSNVNVRNLFMTGPLSPGVGANPRPFGAAGILVTDTVCPAPADTIINIHGNEVENHLEGIKLVNANCVNVGHNVSHDNNSDPFACFGILAIDSGNNNFNNNDVFANGENLAIDGGINIRGPLSADNTVVRNDVSNNFGDGISLRDGAHDNKIVNNDALNNGVAVPGFFFDLADRGAGPGNKWNKNNTCITQFGPGIPAGVCP